MNPGPRFTLRDRCRKARKEAGLEQVELAELIEVTRTTISNYETGKVGVRPMRSTLRRWALVCGVEPAWLIDGVPLDPGMPGGDNADEGDVTPRFHHIGRDLPVGGVLRGRRAS